jgi:FkbM family methyltransferase
MKGIVSAYLLAVMTDRAFFIDWGGPGRLQDSLQPNQVKWKPPKRLYSAANLKMFSQVTLIDKGLTPSRRSMIRSGEIDAGIFQNEKFIWCRCNKFIYDEIQSDPLRSKLSACGIDLSSSESCFKSAFDALFVYRPRKHVQALLDEFLAWRAKQSRVIGIQIRTGGDGDWRDPVLLSESRWDDVCRTLLERLRRGHAGTGVFIATDSARFKGLLKQAISPEFPVWTLDGSILHLDRSDARELSHGSDLVVLENTILSRCDEVLTWKGGFGAVAAWRGGRAPTLMTWTRSEGPGSAAKNGSGEMCLSAPERHHARPAGKAETQLAITAIRDLLKRDDPIVLEIGCNIGQHSRQFLEVFPACTLFCFEPDPRAIKKWRARIVDPRAKLVEAAIGSVDGIVTFYRSDGKEAEGYPEGWDLSGSIRQPKNHLNRWPSIRFERRIDVQCFRLDTWCRSQGLDRVDFIWADTQGAEGDLILGGPTALAMTSFFYTEYANKQYYEGQPTLSELCRLLEPLGFVLERKYPADALFRRVLG